MPPPHPTHLPQHAPAGRPPAEGGLPLGWQRYSVDGACCTASPPELSWRPVTPNLCPFCHIPVTLCFDGWQAVAAASR